MKKYINKLKDLKNTNKKLYIIFVFLLSLISVSFAFVAAQITGGLFKNLNLFADTTDQLEFTVDKALSLTATQQNFTEADNNLSDTSIATAKLMANSTKGNASYTYNVYLAIDENEFKYTTDDKKTEILLEVTDPNGQKVTSLYGLKYDESLGGFDITEEQGIISIVEDYEITSNSSKNYTTQNWIITITFINLDTNQKANAGKNISGKILIQQKKELNGDVTIALENPDFLSGTIQSYNCNNAESFYDSKYKRLEISKVNSLNTNCSLTYSENENNTYLNDYIKTLVNITQGNGNLINEIISIPNYENSTDLSLADYGTTSQYTTSYESSTSGTATSGVFTFSNNRWKTNTSKMSASKAYHLNFTVPSDGYYQVCYSMGSGNYSNRMNFYEGTKSLDAGISSSSIYSGSGCKNIGYLKANTTYRAVQMAYNTIRSIEFRLMKATEVVTANDYRYEGKNPNNYIWFNNELWRIIGIFDQTSHGVENEKLIKIVKSRSIGSFAWNIKGNYGENNWSTSNLNSLLNGAYLNSQDGTDSEFCYGSSAVKSTCNYLKTGISSAYRKMIKEVTWYLGGINDASVTAENSFISERGTNVYYGMPTEAPGLIGLMYPSDYGYASLSNTCARSNSLSNYSSSGCADQNWLYGSGDEWLLTSKNSDSESTSHISETGGLTTPLTHYGYSVRPTLYLVSSIKFISGNGTINDPYIIGL